MQRNLERQTVEMLCKRWVMSRDMIFGLAKGGKLPLWVELFNVRAHLAKAYIGHNGYSG